MEILVVLIFVFGIFYLQKLYFWVTERWGVWETCYRCRGSGQVRGQGYGTNGVEIWPLYEACPICDGRGNIRDESAETKSVNKKSSTTIETKSVRRERKIFGMKTWQIAVLVGLISVFVSVLTAFAFIILK